MIVDQLSIAEARAILIAHEALDLSYEERLGSGNILGTAELDAWAALVVVAEARAASATQVPSQEYLTPSDLHIDAEVFERGHWRSCTGCHELNEGHPTGPYRSALRCNLGVGCHECGGLGAIWELLDEAPT